MTKATKTKSPSSPPPSSATPSNDAESRVDAPLVARAYKKVMARQELTRDERSALKRHEKDKEERLRWEYYRSIPQKHWKEMSGRQTKVINEQADRYELPFGGPTIDLPKLVRRVHDFLAENALKLAKEDDPLLQGGPSSPSLERYREERAQLARLDRLERERELLPRQEVKDALGRVASILKGIGDALQRQFGAGAMDLLFEGLDEAQREIDRSLGAVSESHSSNTSHP